MAGGLARKYDGQREKKGLPEQMGISEGAGPGLKGQVMDWESFFFNCRPRVSKGATFSEIPVAPTP